MSYRCGLGEGFRRIGIEPRDPHLVCDGCGDTRPVWNAHGRPYAWFMDRKKAPGWTANLSGDMRKDWCQKCSASEAQRAASETSEQSKTPNPGSHGGRP